MTTDLKKFLIVNPFGIGDVLFTTPLIKVLKENLPDALIDYWCNERVRTILISNPHLNKVFSCSRGDMKKIFFRSKIQGIKTFINLMRQLKNERFDLAFDFSMDHRYSMLLRLLGVKKIVGFDYKNRGRFLTDKVKIEGYESRHVAEYYLDILKFINIGIKEKPKTELFLFAQDQSFARDFLKIHNLNSSQLIIGVAPAGGMSWAINADYLRWPEEKFASLIERLIREYNAKIILFGAEDEVEICRRIEAQLECNIINMAGKTTLGQFAALLKECKLAICNDAGPLHVAVAVGVKTVCICGPVDEKVYAQFNANYDSRVVKKDLSCRPCYRNFKMPVCPRNKECLNSLSVDEAFLAVKELL